MGLCIVLLLSGCKTINRTPKQLHIPEGMVIFSFDDGPNSHEDTTLRLLEVLRKYEIHAMFALLGENVAHNPELARQIHDDGHCVINHGYADTWAVSLNDEEFAANLLKGEEALVAAIGETLSPKLYRPQGGFYKRRHEKIWREQGYTLVPGTARVHDAILDASDQKRVVQRMVRLIEKRHSGVILLHDARDSYSRMEEHIKKDPDGVFNRSWIPDTVEKIIIALQEKGYKMKGIDIDSVYRDWAE
ncbi:MAG: polysaccharide deacetylase family protein [Treponema sp.]|nr:polysaccharide deacetylase family protein [Treponema sp.]